MSTSKRSPSKSPRGEKSSSSKSRSPSSSRDSRSKSRGRSSSRERSRRRRSSYSRSPSRRSSRQVSSGPPSRVLGIFGLSSETKEQDLRDEFTKFGELDKATLIVDKRTGASKRYGFVNFKNQEDAAKAKEALTGFILHGSAVRIDFSKTKKPHSPTPGRYMGKATFAIG